MTDRALALVDAGAARIVRSVLGQRSRPRHVVGIHVKDAGFRINRWPAPFRAAIESREDNGVLPQAERHKLPFVAEALKLLESPLVHLRSPISQQIFGEKLTCERRGL